MRKLLGFALATAVGIGAAVAAAGPAQAAPPAIEITRVYVNAPGTDTRANKSVNGEYVKLTNRRSSTISLKSWTVRDKANHVHKFGDVKLKPKASLYLHSGKGTNTSTKRYWGSGWHIWNNTGDTAYLRNSSGKLIDSCSWGKVSSYRNC
ncbi:lamin tail domain-containing protein [Micromonospora rosaria]|uniref:lamin tail domain-containing protein n=1 Tax=Micromonospora rosaria TaxID=47874 RepID=UPI000A3F1F79|nr:lamin tail domain-containing protein [Micromonospora rosaria]